MLPGTTHVAGNPRLAGILILFGGAADAANDLLLGFFWFGDCFLGGLLPALLGDVDLVELFQSLVLALCGSNRSARLGFRHDGDSRQWVKSGVLRLCRYGLWTAKLSSLVRIRWKSFHFLPDARAVYCRWLKTCVDNESSCGH